MNNNNKKVSVIVPVYNVEKYISNCINSILNQTYSDIELILINDGSTDASGDICKSFEDRYDNIKYCFQSNAGVSAARNVGLDLSSGEYITFVDSDDTIKPQMIELLVNALEREDADLSICGYDLIREGKITPVPLTQAVLGGEINVAKYFAINFQTAATSSPCCRIYKKALISHRFDTNLYIGEDLFFNLGYIQNVNKIIVIDDTLYNYDRSNDISITNKYSNIYFYNEIFVFKSWYDFFLKYDNVDLSKLYLRVSQSYFNYLFCLCNEKSLEKNVNVLSETIDSFLTNIFKESKQKFSILKRFVLWLTVHRKFRLVLLSCSAYRAVKKLFK